MSLLCHPALHHCLLFKVIRRARSDLELNQICSAACGVFFCLVFAQSYPSFPERLFSCVLWGAPGSNSVLTHQAPPEQPQLDYFCRVLSESAPRGSTVLRASGKQSTQAPIKNSRTSLISGWQGSLHRQQCLIQVFKAKLKSFFTRLNTLIFRKEHL